MLTGSASPTAKLRTSKGALVLVGFVFVFLIASLAIGMSSSALSVPASKGCHGGGEGDDAVATCTTSSSTVTVTSSSSSSTTTTSSKTTTSTTTTTTTSTAGPNDPVIVVNPANCNALDGITYQGLSAGTILTIAWNGNGQMTFKVPSESSFSWNWYWIPAGGQSTTTLGQQITTSMWASGHGQDFSFFVAKLNGATGIVLQTDYALSHACSS